MEWVLFFFFQAEDGIRDLVRSRGLGDVYKRQATGVELDPSRDYSGGLETVRFFHALGLPTQHDQSPGPAEPTAEPTPSLSAPTGEPLGLRREHREPQKRALAELLRCRYGTIEVEAQFPWLIAPRPDQMDETMGTVSYTHLTLPTIYSV